MDFSTILTRMLTRGSSVFDKREGSILHDTYSPAAYELAAAYDDMDKLLANTYAGTADRAGLIKRAEEIGLYPNAATYAIRKGTFTPSTLELDIGLRFNFEKLNYAITEKLADGEYALTCETIGTAGNYGSGNLLPIQYVEGLETASLSDVLVYGEEEEDTETFRTRYFDAINAEARDGNVSQYIKWSNEFAGIGNAKVFSLWNGANTVKVSILNSENGIASNKLISDFQMYLDPNSSGLGNGVAPIGAIVTVSTASTIPINITADITLAENYSSITGLDDDIKALFKKIAYDESVVSYVLVGSTIWNNASVGRIANLRINNDIEDVVLAAEQIPILGTTEWTVV